MASTIQLYIKNDLKRELKIKAASDGVSISEVARHYLTNWKFGLFGYVKLEDKNKLPKLPVIYFVISNNGKVEYIGRSNNARTRFRNHHRKEDFEKLVNPTIHWIHMDEDLIETERLFIEIVSPDMNYLPGTSDETSLPTTPKRSFMIDKELWETVKNKAETANVSVSAIIRALLKMWANGDVEIQL
jgi:uncharacterized protein (UPF0297 family)